MAAEESEWEDEEEEDEDELPKKGRKVATGKAHCGKGKSRAAADAPNNGQAKAPKKAPPSSSNKSKGRSKV